MLMDGCGRLYVSPGVAPARPASWSPTGGLSTRAAASWLPSLSTLSYRYHLWLLLHGCPGKVPVVLQQMHDCSVETPPGNSCLRLGVLLPSSSAIFNRSILDSRVRKVLCLCDGGGGVSAWACGAGADAVLWLWWWWWCCAG